MKKLLQLKTMLLLCALIVGSGSVWADTEVTFTAGTEKGSNGSNGNNDTMTKGGITIYGSNLATTTSEYRIYSGCDLTISSEVGNITSIVINSTANKGSKYGPDLISTTTGTYSTTTGSSVGTWTGSAESVTFSASAQCRASSIVVTYAVPLTITATSNNNEWGTVSGTTTITATPYDGYRVKSGDDGYTVVEGTADVTNNGDNTFSVSPTTDCTVQINFEAIPTHSVSCVSSPVEGGSVEATSPSVREQATTTITASANAGYKFTGWSVSGTGASLSSTSDNPTTLTMGTTDATVTATFEAVTTYAIKWSVNGTVIKTENIEENASINFADPASGIPAGYVFQGWVTETNLIDGTTDVDQSDNYVTSASSTANITYYAVMAIEQESPFTAHLTGDEIASNFASSGMKYTDSEASYDDTDDGVTWGTRCITNTSRHWIQLKSDKDVYIKAAASGNISEVKVKISNATNASGGIDDITKHGGFSGNVKLDAAQDTNTGTYGSASSSKIVNNILTIEPSKSSSTLYIHVDASARIWNVDITYNSVSASNYCTTVNNVIANVSDYGWITFCSDDYALDFTGGVTGLNAYMITGHSGTSVIMSEVTGTVPAKTGLLLKGSKNTSYNIPITTSSSTNVSSNLLKPGTGAAVSAEEGKTKYVLGVNGELAEFQKIVGTAATVAKGKAYLQFDEEIDARALTFDFDEQTGISETKRETINNNRFYNLNGQQVAQPTKGLYIVNGRKYIVK